MSRSVRDLRGLSKPAAGMVLILAAVGLAFIGTRENMDVISLFVATGSALLSGRAHPRDESD